MSEISTSQTAPPSIAGEWRSYIRFVSRPTLAEARSALGPQAFQATAALFLLDVAAMLVLAGCAALYIAAGGEMPHHALDGLKLTAPLVLMIVLVGPIFEEAAFRGWLTGTARALSLYGTVIVVAAAIMLSGSFDRIAAAILLAALLVGVIGSLMWLPGNAPIQRFEPFFPYLFWGSSIAFALVHLTNLTLGHNRLAILWVLPQLISGTIFGYARIRYGMWSNVMLHMAHNAVMMLVALSAGLGS